MHILFSGSKWSTNGSADVSSICTNRCAVRTTNCATIWTTIRSKLYISTYVFAIITKPPRKTVITTICSAYITAICTDGTTIRTTN